MASIASSRSLLLPGPQPPLSHFGATLLKHVVTTGLRYALHSLGAPMPEGAPIRMLRLRVYLDRDRLDIALGDSPAAAELIGALLEPGGSGKLPAAAAQTRGAATFHRARLRLRRRASGTPAGRDPADTGWSSFRELVSQLQPRLSEAFLGELLAALERRARRLGGRTLKPCLGRQALAFGSRKKCDLGSLGVADPFVGPWSSSPRAPEHAASRLGTPTSGAVGHPFRGEFREAYRRALNPIRAAYLRLAEAARDRGLIDEIADAFFIPFELGADLALDQAPAWLAPAVASNRAEYQRALESGGPSDAITAGATPKIVDDRDAWVLGPLWPLA